MTVRCQECEIRSFRNDKTYYFCSAGRKATFDKDPGHLSPQAAAARAGKLGVMGMGMMGFGLLMMFFGLLVLVGLVATAVWAVIYFTGPGRTRGTGDAQARQILDQRYARGEIGDDEYQRMRRQLG